MTGWIYGDESEFDKRRGGLMTDYAPDVPDFGGQLSALTYDHGTTAPHYDPATFAARELALTLQGSHIKVKASRHDGVTPGDARILATVSSPPMSVMTRLMDVPSDDLFAEMFTKQLGVLFGRGGTISDGATVISHTIAASYGLHPKILDGSGLSRDDRTSPLEIVDLLHELWGTSVGRELIASLPTVGRNGTVQGIGVKTAAAGNCVAKTGTLNYVTNLAGYCRRRGHPDARVRAVHRRTGQRDRDRAGEPHDRRDRPLLTTVLPFVHNRTVELAAALNLGEMHRYLNRVGDRWPLQVVMIGGARVDDSRGAPPQRERGPEFVVVLVSRAFDGMPWLERVYQATSLWDGMEMGDTADVHCYTVDGVPAPAHHHPGAQGRGGAGTVAVRGFRSALPPAAADRRPTCDRRPTRDRRPARHRRTRRRHRAQLIATIRSIGNPRPVGDRRRHLDLVDVVAQRVAQLGQRDHLHEPARGGLVGGDELDVGGRLAQRMEHPGLGGDDRGGAAPGRRRASSSRA